LSDLRQRPKHPAERWASRRAVLLVVGVVVVAVVAALIVVLTRDGGSTSDGSGAAAETSAASKLGWGKPNRVDYFNGPLGSDWNVYNGPGHNKNGRRSPAAISVSDGVLTIDGDSAGTTGGLAWRGGQKYGRWEGRVRAPASDRSYNALLLLWPDSENWPAGGEIDFMEMDDSTRQRTSMFVHFGPDDRQLTSRVKADATQWHNWAVEWTPDHIATFLDGNEWYRTSNPLAQPPGPMHLCIQLDWFPANAGSKVQQSSMQVDWVAQYPL